MARRVTIKGTKKSFAGAAAGSMYAGKGDKRRMVKGGVRTRKTWDGMARRPSR